MGAYNILLFSLHNAYWGEYINNTEKINYALLNNMTPIIRTFFTIVQKNSQCDIRLGTRSCIVHILRYTANKEC